MRVPPQRIDPEPSGEGRAAPLTTSVHAGARAPRDLLNELPAPKGLILSLPRVVLMQGDAPGDLPLPRGP